MGTRAGSYKLEAQTRSGKYKLGTRPGKYKLRSRASKYKLGTRAGGRDQGPRPGLGAKQRARGQETQRPQNYLFFHRNIFKLLKINVKLLKIVKSKWEHFTSDHHRMFHWIILHRERHETKRIENVYISFEFSKARLSGKWTSF